MWRRVHCACAATDDVRMAFISLPWPSLDMCTLNLFYNMRESESSAAAVVTYSSVTNGFRFSQGKLICAAGATAIATATDADAFRQSEIVRNCIYTYDDRRCVVFVGARRLYIYAANSLHHCSVHGIQHELGSQISCRDFTSRPEI